MSKRKKLLVFAVLIAIIYFLGPKPSSPELNPQLPNLAVSLESLDVYIDSKEKRLKNIRPNNESKII